MTPIPKIAWAIGCSLREEVSNTRLGLGQQAAASQALQDAREDEERQVGRQAAQGGSATV